MPNKIEDLSITELKTKLVTAAKETKEAMAEMLYYLRQKIKAQGKKGEGFGAWVEENLGITRRTADNWANEWAEVAGLRKKPTSGKGSKGRGGDGGPSDGPRKEFFCVNLQLTPSEQEEWLMAWEVLGEETATQLLYETLTEAAKAQGPKSDPFRMELGELQTVHASPSGKRLPFLKDGEAQ